MALKPKFTESPQVRLIDLKSKPFFIVASVEVGNTTTKSILTATNMETCRTHIVNKIVGRPGMSVLQNPEKSYSGKRLQVWNSLVSQLQNWCVAP